MDKKKIIACAFFILIICPGLLFVFFEISLKSILSILYKDSILQMSYGSILCMIIPVITYVFFSDSIKVIYCLINKKKESKKEHNKKGFFVVSWFVLSLPITWYLSFYLTSNGYQKCPSTDLFTQYYTTDLFLCSSPP
ncbi:DUF1240 domain-containing protein [Morganella morganii]